MRPILAVTGLARLPDPVVSAGPELQRREESSVEAILLMARRCLEEAGVPAGPDVGLVLAAGSAIRGVNAAHARVVLAGSPVSAHRFLYTTPNALAARAAILLGLPGECLTLPDPAAPFWAAADLLAAGRSAAVLAGGIAPGPRGLEGGLLCVETTGDAAARGVSPVGFLDLYEPGTGAKPVGPTDEAATAVTAVDALRSAGEVVVDCGRRGRIAIRPLESMY